MIVRTWGARATSANVGAYARHFRESLAPALERLPGFAGALTNPVDSAMLVFAGDSPAVAEAFAKADPYVTNGLVKTWKVRGWTTVVGDTASTPVHPSTGKPS